jgi:hypothetical protein
VPVGLLHDLEDGEKREISEADYAHFLDVLPPVAFGFPWNGERWGFGFAEGSDFVYAFKREAGRYFAQETTLLNPNECGHSIEDQQRSPGFVERLGREQEAARAASWIPTWLKIGRESPWIREATDPPFDTRSFHPCVSDEELLEKFTHGNWSLGQAFFRGDLCFVQQVDGGDEWLAIKQGVPFESISFGRIIAAEGRPAAQEIIDRIRAVPVEKCKALEY